jgi:hypothetical protein
MKTIKIFHIRNFYYFNQIIIQFFLDTAFSNKACAAAFKDGRFYNFCTIAANQYIQIAYINTAVV